MARLKVKYTEEVAPALFKKFGYTSTMQVPKIEKVVVNVGCGEARENAKVLEAVVRDLSTITGQKAIITNAKKSVANFKLREGMPVGAKVTLRGDKMWEFLDRLFNVALPRVRDFRGISANAFDDDLALLGADGHDLTGLAAVVTSEDQDGIVLFHVHLVTQFRHLHQRTSGARDRIFI